MDWQQLMQAVGPYLGAMPSQQAPTQQAQGMPGQAAPNPQAQPKLQYGTGDIIGSPLLQGALQGYFGYLAGGRGESPLQRLGTGGLMGLQGYAQGRANQLAAPLRAAELQKTQAEAAKTGMETQQLQQQVSGRKAFADAFRQTSTYKSMAPQQAELTATALQAGIYKPEDIMRTPIQQEEFNLKLRDQARADKAQAETQRYHNASIERMKAMESIQQQDVGMRGAALGIEGANLRERQMMDKWRKGQVAGTAMTPAALTKIDKTAHDLGVKDAGPAPKPPTGLGTFVGRHSGYDAAATKDYQDQLQKWRQDVQVFTAQHKAELTNEATAGAAATRSAAMSGGDEEGGSGLRLGATVTAPDGTVHRYKGGPTDDPSSYEPVAP